MLLNLEDIMSMKAIALPTINEGFYTDLVEQQSRRKPFVVQIPVELDDAYNFGDQYMQRLMTYPKDSKSVSLNVIHLHLIQTHLSLPHMIAINLTTSRTSGTSQTMIA